MDKVAHIHLKGPFIKAAKALIPEKPLSLGWNTQFPRKRWGFIFKGNPSKRAIEAARNTGLDFIRDLKTDPVITALSIPDVKESEVKEATRIFEAFAEEYKNVSKRANSIINSHINEDATVVREITIKAGRRQLGSVVECIKQFYHILNNIN